MMSWEWNKYHVENREIVRFKLSAVMALCSSGEPRRPTTLMMITCQLLQTPQLPVFVGGFINDTTSINPTRRLFPVLPTSLQGYSSPPSHPQSSATHTSQPPPTPLPQPSPTQQKQH